MNIPPVWSKGKFSAEVLWQFLFFLPYYSNGEYTILTPRYNPLLGRLAPHALHDLHHITIYNYTAS
jgi:hypothetical protein